MPLVLAGLGLPVPWPVLQKEMNFNGHGAPATKTKGAPSRSARNTVWHESVTDLGAPNPIPIPLSPPPPLYKLQRGKTLNYVVMTMRL